MKRRIVVLLLLFSCLPSVAFMTLEVKAATLEVGPGKTYAHPQDAVNAATPGDTILVYPGTYGTRDQGNTPPHYGDNDRYAPVLIVYKDNLIIEAADPDPSLTIIQSTHNCWSNPIAIQWSTGGTWDGTKYVGAGVYPVDGTAPNAIAVVASGVTIRGFTLKRHYEGTYATYNTAGVMIGGLYAGDTQFPGHANNNIVEDCVFEDVWHAVYIWHSSGNIIRYNTVGTLTTNHWAAISTYDGYNDAQTGLPNPSENNLIRNNVLANKGIALGAWDPPTWTSVAGSKVCCNTATQVGVSYAHGPVAVGCNLHPSGGPSGFWEYMTDKVICINGISYTGDSGAQVPGDTLVDFAAQLNYAGSSDGSGIQVEFIYDSTTVPATTIASGSASCQVNLYHSCTVTAKVTLECCAFTDSALLEITPVGGEWVPIDTLQMLVQVVGSIMATSALVASFVGIRRIKRKQN